MVTILSAVLGFFGSMLPDVLALFRDNADRKHERHILELQLKQQELGRSERLEEVRLQADAVERVALYRTYHTGIAWVDALNGTVRPVLAYAFFLLYALVKFMTWVDGGYVLWTDEDHAVFAGIISFYFGQRAFGKVRK
jgi:hypothetical protein